MRHVPTKADVCVGVVNIRVKASWTLGSGSRSLAAYSIQMDDNTRLFTPDTLSVGRCG